MSKKKDRKKVGKFIDLDALEMQKTIDQIGAKLLLKLRKKILKNPEVCEMIRPSEQNDDYPGFINCDEKAQINLLSKLTQKGLVGIVTRLGYKLQIK